MQMDWEIEQPKSLTEVAVQRIRDAIISGDLALGEKLSEQMLADRFKVSRSPVRDALALLQSEGMVNVFSKKGSFVFTPVSSEVADQCEYRTILETAALKLAIVRNQTRLCSELELHLKAMGRARLEADPAAYTRGDLAFHDAIINCSGNRSLVTAYSRMIGPILALRSHLFVVMNEVLERSLEEHELILTACREGNAEDASRVMSTHIDHVYEAFETKERKDSLNSEKGRASDLIE